MTSPKVGSISATNNLRLILGSSSPRRRALLETLGILPDAIQSPDIDEAPKKGEAPRQYCQRMAREKNAALASDEMSLILTADTTVALGNRILGKPADRDEAEKFLRLLSGRRHRVFTAIALRKHDRLWERNVETRVKVKRLSDREIQSYLASKDWEGKAGAYAIQGPAGAFIPWISGSYSAVMGLPLAETAALLRAAGYEFS